MRIAKCLLSSLSLLITSATFAQESVMDSLTYAESQDIEFASLLPNGTTFDRYIASDGSVIEVGDQLMIGRPSTNTNLFTYWYFGRFTAGKAAFVGAHQLQGNAQAEIVTIEKIFVQHTKISRKSAVGVILHTYNPNLPRAANGRSLLDYEKAFLLGEVINPNAKMTREQAIDKLKESKDLLDLGIISQGKYDSLKKELTPIIVGQ